MHLGWDAPGKAIYWIYSWFCHQFPQRSFFLFGSQFTYSLAEVQKAWQNTSDPLLLRQFIGNSALGWKVAWSDRMVSMYLSTLVFGIWWWPIRRKIKPLPWWGVVLFLLPMAVDGVSHFFSDLPGLGVGFRSSNAWLAALTQQAFPASFYVGEAWGSFNSLARLATGVFFGVGVVWFGFPYMDMAFSQQTLPSAKLQVYHTPQQGSSSDVEKT
jgi:uncharacterized membrane protein